jgi:hypothetical protein
MTIQTVVPYLVGTILVVSLTIVSAVAVQDALQTGLSHGVVAQTVESINSSASTSASTPTLDSINARKAIGYQR